MQWLAELCIRRPVLAGVITIVMVAAGVFAFSGLNVSRYPNVDLPIITVVTQYRGASAEEVETDITRPIENAVSGVDGIDHVTSTSARGFSIVVAQFVLEKTAGVAAQEVRDKIGAISDLPAGIAPPNVLAFDPDQIPVAVVALSADRPIRELSDYADGVARPHLAGAAGVAQVSLVGDRLRQINVRVNPLLLAAHGLSATGLLDALETSAAQTGGGAQQFIPHAVGRIADLSGMAIAFRGGRAVLLGDVARIEDGAAPPQTIANVDGTRAVLLYVRKQAGANTVRVVREVRDRLETLRATLPRGYHVRVVWDQSEYVLAATHAVEEHLLLGALLAALVVLVFLWDWRSAVIPALAIPISLISTFALLAALHLTLNTFTLLALALVIGIVIDDAIVVLENIYRLIHEQGVPAFQAAIAGTREVGPAVMATTLSLIVVFLPLAFMSGIVGRFMSSFGWTMAFAIAVSLVVSFTLTPSLAALWLDRAGARSGARTGEAAAAEPRAPFRAATERAYRWLLEGSLARRRLLLALSALTLLSIVPLWAAVNQSFLPSEDESQFEVTGRAPGDATLEATSALGTRIAAAIRRLPGIAFTVVTAGDDPQHSPNAFTIFVRMVPLDARGVSQQQEVARVRTEVLPAYRAEGVATSVNDIFDLSGSAASLQYLVSGPDLHTLNHAAAAAGRYLRTLAGVVDIQSSLAAGAAVDVKVNAAQAARLGVSVPEAANTLALLAEGVQARQLAYADGGRFYPVDIREDVPGASEQSALLGVPVLSSAGRRVPLGSLLDIRPPTGPGEITHFNRERAVMISANLLPEASSSLGRVVTQLNRRMHALGLPPAYHAGATGVAEQVSRTQTAFAQAFAMAFVLMYLVLAAQFDSWLHPITILISLPLTVPFALISVLLLRGSLNPLSYLGILVLFGVVKKNAILQVARTNQLRAQGMAKDAAIVQASLDRLRPILMTTLAFVAGMIPLALSRGAGTASSQAISTVIIGGQMLSLLLTLAAVPVFYSVLDDVETGGLAARLWTGLTGRRRTPGETKGRFVRPAPGEERE